MRYWRCRAPAKWLEGLLWPMVGHLVKIRGGEAYCTRCPWRDVFWPDGEHWHLVGHESEVLSCTPYRPSYASWAEFGGRVDEEQPVAAPREQCPWRLHPREESRKSSPGGTQG